ncbi:ABC transporter ATP-binding protein [Shewanella surugensis]|uniref:ABC transporter ATP-binding protein n=1 Tax=Shewanella surugensis TaxID=212020 RepID=A0ABT0LEQ4_9GAMM|nr:ABC transporter ATP-binding protein [Shewanella surugensis]MCL1126181.1 ABC transporter ATP-binding protein [Shewanella surugensis]
MSLIHCHNLTKNYASKRALNQVNLSLEAGQPIALVGPNGAGKTTLFSLLCGYIQPSSGKVTLFGHPPGSQALLGKVASLPQDASLDPNLTIMTQLSLFARLQGFSNQDAEQEALRVLDLVGLVDNCNQKPTALSHGMGKRVSIAQALIGSPELVLLDEPTAGLDPANAKVIRHLVKSQSKNTTFVISSHNLDELEKLCDQVLYLDNGQLSQSVSMNDSQQQNYLTLTMSQCEVEVLVASISAMSDIITVEQKQDNEFIIQHDKANIEIALFTLFSEQGWQYKSLLKGRRLEEKLFS